jgi:hypothetical protein
MPADVRIRMNAGVEGYDFEKNFYKWFSDTAQSEFFGGFFLSGRQGAGAGRGGSKAAKNLRKP